MKIEEIEHALGLLIAYNEHIIIVVRNILVKIRMTIRVKPWDNLLKSRTIDDLLNQVFFKASDILKFIESAEDIENLISKNAGLLHKDLREDMETIRADLNVLFELIKDFEEHIAKSRAASNVSDERAKSLKAFETDLGSLSTAAFVERANEFIERFETILSSFERICQKDIYIEQYVDKYVEEYVNLHRFYWQQYIHNQFEWLYHGTSILFLGNIKVHGLDNSKISSGIRRAIETISAIYENANITRVDINTFQDLDTELSKKKVALTWHKRVRAAAMTSNLPAFLYELLDEHNLNDDVKRILLSKVSREERFMLMVIWRFGRMLRRKNKLIHLYIKIDSTFLKYYNIPDIISDFNAFAEIFVYPTFKKLTLLDNLEAFKFIQTDAELEKIHKEYGGLIGMIRVLLKSTTGFFGPDEIFVQNVHPQFIYVNVNGHFLPISKVTEDMAPLID
tara:strand:- start:3178 stop:4533 length:1356 start_codon:yes stop_codon:yes gene_type:complete